MPEFKLNIELGNAAMQTPQDVAAALRKVADKVDTFVPGEGCFLPVVDLNGNSVGSFIATFPETEEDAA